MLRSVLQHFNVGHRFFCTKLKNIFNLFHKISITCVNMENILIRNFSNFAFDLREETHDYLKGSTPFNFSNSRKVEVAHKLTIDNSQGGGGYFDELKLFHTKCCVKLRSGARNFPTGG